jgi:O-antigen ligase
MTASHVAISPAEWRPWAAPATITWLEQGLVIGAFIIFCGTFDTLLTTVAKPRTEGTPLFQALSGGIYLSGIALLLYRGVPRGMIKVLFYSLPLVFLVLFAFSSTFWSVAPDTTFRRAVALVLSSLFALYVITRFDARTIFKLLTIAFIVFIVVGIVAGMIPGVGRTGGWNAYAGSWRGLTGNKNNFGRTLALAVALLPAAAAVGLIEWRRLVFLLTPVALALLFLSRSATSLVTAFGSIVVGTAMYVVLGGRIGRFRLAFGFGLVVGVIGVIVGALTIVFGWTVILEALGRDPTLTGRTRLWEWALALSAELDRVWLGSGYRTFWVDENTKYFFEDFAWGKDFNGNLSDSYGGPSHSHSGYVDVIVELGYVGLTVFAAFVFSALANLRRTLSRGKFDVGFIFAVILSFLLIYATTAKSILQQSEDLWFLVTLIYLMSVKESLLTGAGAISSTVNPRQADG